MLIINTFNYSDCSSMVGSILVKLYDGLFYIGFQPVGWYTRLNQANTIRYLKLRFESQEFDQGRVKGEGGMESFYVIMS